MEIQQVKIVFMILIKKFLTNKTKEKKMKFKVGDKVRCIDLEGLHGYNDLVKGSIYEVTDCLTSGVKLKSLPGAWLNKRFEKVEDTHYQFTGFEKWNPPRIWFDELSLNKSNEYKFRGEINIDHLINDCIKDQKTMFLAINKTHGIVGISKQLPIKDKAEFFNLLTDAHEEEVQKAFYIIHINKKDIGIAVKELTRLSKLVKNRLRNLAKKLKKNSKAGKYSNEPETKVMVY